MDIDRVAHWEKGILKTKVASQVANVDYEYPKTSFEIIQSLSCLKLLK